MGFVVSRSEGMEGNADRPREGMRARKSKMMPISGWLILSGGLLFFSLACRISISWIPYSAPAGSAPTRQMDPVTKTVVVTPIASVTPTALSSVSLLMDVYADQEWQNTGVSIATGQKFTVQYLSGQIHDDGIPIYDGNGLGPEWGEAGCCAFMPHEWKSSLIGRVGRRTFFIGNGDSFLADTSGVLELRVNDCNDGLSDNDGSLRVRIAL